MDTIEGRVVAGVIRYPGVREIVRPLGPWLFEDEFVREIAAAVLNGDAIRPEYARSATMNAVAAEVLLYLESTDEPWATHLLDLLIRERELPLLAATLRWAADAIDAGKPPQNAMSHVAAAAQRAHL